METIEAIVGLPLNDFFNQVPDLFDCMPLPVDLDDCKSLLWILNFNPIEICKNLDPIAKLVEN